MAFVLVFVGLPYVGAEAAAGDVTLQGAISATTTESSIKATLNGQTDTTDNNGKTYTYNGNIKTTNVKLFDYFSDSEYGGTGSPSQSWDNGYSNPYNKFNTAVSSDYPDSYTPTNTITLNYKGNKIAANQSTVYAHLWCSYDSSYSTEWQVGIPMTWDSANSQYTVTFNPSTVPNNQMKNSAKKFDADHMPDKVIFHLNGSTTNREEFSQAMMLEHTYTFGVTGSSGPTTINLHITHDPNSINSAKLNIGSSSWDLRQMSYVSGATGSYKDFTCVIPAGDLSFTPDIFQCNFNNDSGWWTNQLSITWVEGNTYTINYASANTISMSSTSGSGQDSSSVLVEGPDCKYTDPLYFGAFYMSNNGTDYTDTNKPGLPDGKSGGPYNNFYWQSHISLKGNTNSYNATRGKAALQGLVDPNLTGNSASGELQQGGKILPYFNETWANTNNNVMTYYNKDDLTSKSISFPFYEVTIGATNAFGYQAGDNSAGDSVAKYYQFNSELNNLYFEKGSTANSGHFVETSWGDHIKGDQQGSGNSTDNGKKKEGFFPFNTNSSENKNYGFGARFDMDFHLNEDGKIAVYDANDKQKNGAGRVNTRFEFTGDDDLWVFIDGHLVLDLGGVHDATSGYIDFTERKAVADYAITLGDGDSKDALYYYNNDNTQVVTPDSIAVQDTFTRDGDNNITGWATDGDKFSKLINGNNTATTYDTSEPHTLTVFYMERGMFDSNLKIRFNFPIEPNFNKLKIREDTDFSGINEGLRELTMQAAEDDVFKYTVKNTGTKRGDVIDGTSLYPTQVDNTRNGRKLTSTTTPYYGTNTEPKSINFDPANTTTEYPMANVSYNWIDGFADNEGMVSANKVAGITNGNGELFLMFGTSSVKSSAEFEGQLSRYSTMRVTQISGNDYLYKPKTNGNNAITFEQSTRKYSDYYSMRTPYIFTKKSNSAGYTGTGVVNGNLNVTNGGTYTVRSDLGSSNVKDADETKEVQMTEYFTNVPNTGGITIKKLLPSGETVVPSDKTTFTIKVRFEDIFGVSDVNANSASQYEAITYSVYDNNGAVTGKTDIPMGSSTMTVNGESKVCGTVTVGVNQWAVIDNIPYNTTYIIDEDEPYYAKPNVTNRTVITGTINDSTHLATQSNNNAEVTNFSHTLTIKEVTDFSTVNSGLLSYTKTAAEKDVFKYTVSNQNTSDGDVVDSGVKTPTYDEYKRGNVTLTKQQPIQYDYVYDDDSIFLDVKIDDSNYWDSGNYVIAATFQDDTTPNAVNTDFIIGEKIEGTTVYKFTGYSDDAVQVGFFRLYANQAPFVTETDLWPNSGKIRHRAESTLGFHGGELFKITGWGSDGKSPCQEDTENSPYVVSKSVVYNAPHNYKPSLGSAVANTDYEWKDEFAGLVGSNADGINGMTGTTGSNGEFYLMHGTEAYTKGATQFTQDKESSAKFYNQFKRTSTMTVVQDGTLTSPNGGTPDTLKANNQRGAGTSLATYYSTTKTLEGSTTSSSLTNNVLPTGTNNFAFDNNDTSHSIHITETFKNTVKTGTLKITKAINPTEGTNTTQTNAEFTFKITLTNVFGVTNNNDVGRTDYANIAVTKTGTGASGSYSMAPSSNTTENSGTFTLKAGQTLTIPDIPVGTHYEIEELSNTDSTKEEYNYELNKIYKKVDTSSSTGTYTEQSGATTITGDIVSGETHDFKVANKRKTATLRLSKSLYAYIGAAGNSDTVYNFKVALEPPTGVTLNSTNYPLTCTNSDTTTVSYNYTTHTVTVTAKANTSATISGIPYGTGFTVTEVSPTGSPVVEYNGSILENLTGNITGDTTATITNTYRKITMTKVDAEDHSLGVVGATYYLLRLKTGVDATTTDAKNEFEGTNATHTTFASSSYFEVCSGLLTTGSGGTVEVNDANVTNGLKPGKYIFFEEDAPDNYERNNSYTSDKIIEIPDNKTTLTYTKNNHEYTDTRKKGTLTLSKSVVAGTGTTLPDGVGTQPFEYTVTLTHTDSNVKLNNYSITCTDQNNNPISGSYTAGTNTYTFTATVHSGDTNPVTFTNLPYGTRYSVSETSSLPACIEITGSGTNSSPVTGGIGETDSTTNTGPSKNASITNTYKTGSLTISKTLAGNNSNYNYDTNKEFTFTVTLTPETSTFVDLSKYTFTDSNSKITNTSYDHKTITLKLKHGESTTIGNIPQGTKFTVAETNPNDSSSVKYQITGGSEVSGQYSTPSGDSNTNVITSTAKTVAFTNTYPNTVSLTLGKRTTGTKPSNAPTNYTFNVYFSSTIGFSGYTIKKAVGGNTAADITTDFNTNHNPYVLTINAGSENDVVISGLPADTTYRVVEDSTSKTGTVSPDGGTTAAVEGEMSSALSVNGNDTHTITNHYPDVYTLKLKKLVSGELPSSMGSNPTFKFRVTLTPPSGVTLLSSSNPSGTVGYQITQTPNGGSASNVNTPSSFVVELQAGNESNDTNTVTIGNIPKGTTYTVEEESTYINDATSTALPSFTQKSGEVKVVTEPSNEAERTINADKSATITNTYPEVGSLTLSKSLQGESNASTTPSQNPDGGTVFIFKVELTAPSSPAVDLREYLNTTAISSMAYSGSSQTYNETSGVYTCYIAVKSGDDPKKIISNIPYGTHYKVTEVYNTSDGSMSSTGLKPDVSYSKAEGNINDPSVVAAAEINPTAGVTNTYRKVTLNKKDVKQNSSNQDIPLSDAYYVLLRLKPDLTSEQRDLLQAAFASAPSSVDNISSDFATYYTNSLAAYCNGQSSIKQTVSGQLEIRNSEMTDGLTEGEYFFLELVPPVNYERSNILSGNTITINTTNDDANSPKYTYSKTLTDTRKTGTLTLLKTNTGTYKPSDYEGKTYTYKLKLTKPSDLTDFTGYAITKQVGSAAATSYSPTSGNWDTITVSKSSSVIISGLPYGTKYEVYEDETLPDYLSSDHLGETNKIEGYVGETGTVGGLASTPTPDANITNTYRTGQLTLTKTTSGTNAPTTATTFTFTGKFKRTDDVNPDTYTFSPEGSPSGVNVTFTKTAYNTTSKECTFTATVEVPANSNTASIVISGIPYGTQYIDVMEDETASSLPAGVTVTVTGGTGTTVTDKKASGTINSTNNAHTVNVENNYPQAGQLTITKTVVGTLPSSENGSFTIHYAFQAPGGAAFTGNEGILKNGSAFGPIKDNVYTETLTNGGTITFSNLPNGTMYKVYEEHTAPSGVSWSTTGGTGSSSYATFDASTGASVDIHNIYPYTGTLTLSKELSGEDNASSEVTPNTDFTFKITLKEPSGITFLNNYLTGLIDNTTENDGAASQKTYTIYKTVKKSNTGATAVKIEGIPNGTIYTVTEVKSDHSDISGDSNKPSVTYSNTASGTITATDSNVSVVATVTNTYRKVTLTKKDSRNNHVLNGAVYVLVRLKEKDGSNNTIDYDDTTVKGVFSGADELSDITDYIDGRSSELTTGTNGVTSDDGKIVVKSSQMGGGLIPGKYFFFEKTAPANYTQDNSLDGKIFTITEGTSPDPTYDKDYTDVRKTGKLTLTKTNEGTYKPSDADSKTYDYKLKLTKPSDLTDFTGYTITKKVGNGTADSYTPSSDWVTIQVSEDSPVEIDGLPYGTEFEVYEDGTLPSYLSSDHPGASNEIQGYVGETDSTTNSDNPATANITNTYSTGSLKLIKKLDKGTEDTTTEFTYNVVLNNSTLDLRTYISNPPANITVAAESIAEITNTTNLSAGTVYSEHKIAFDVKIKAGTDVTISGLPYDTTYDVLENLPSSQWKKVRAESFSDSTKTIDSTAADTVEVTNALVGDLVLKKTLDSNASANDITPSNTFRFEVTLTPPENMSLDDFITYYIGISNVGGSDAASKFIKIDSDTKLKRIFEIAGDNAEHTAINDLPYGTTYSVVEKDDSQNKTTSVVYALNGTTGAITDKVISADNVVTTTNNYPQLGSLNIAKIITGDGAPSDQQFTFTVTLTPQNGTLIDLEDFTFTHNGGTDFTVSADHKTITVKLTGGNNVNISGIPVVTGYQISESSVDDWTQTDSSNTSGTISADGIHASFTNNYGVPITVTGSLTVTKTDTNGRAITDSKATYYLMKLNSDFNTAYENDPVALSNIFKTAASVSDLSTYYSGYYGPKQTDSNGQVVFDSNDNGLDTIAAGDKFFFYEVQAPYGYAIDNSLTYVDSSGNTHSKILTVTESDKHPTAVYPNPNTTGVSVYKTNEYGEGLENGEFDLYYKQENKTTPPPTYSYNKPETPPIPNATTKINRNNLTVPNDAAGTSQVTTYTYEYSYPSEPSMPSSTEEDWILPRSDNDYIYFRDYNTGTINSKDTEAFYYQDSHNNDKRYWINTWLDNNEFGQNEEVGYDHRYKIKAQFTKNGSDFKEYEAWERFVDIYTDSANNVTRKTVVWKIQPPDGYNKVRFCLYDGGQCIRTTQEFSYVLGNIYTKTNRGSGTDNKWDYPVTGEHWSTNWNGTGAGQSDKRMSYSTFYGTNGAATGNAGVNTNHYVYNDTQNATSNQQAPEQTQRYTATEQKIVFQCNSKQVWHNIHIEFFSSNDENDRIGQGFPGYMMEPYAFAGNDYRLKGYLTYELTIPKGATHFRINNGVENGSYAYKTKITALKTDTTKNNYGNFFKFPNTPQNGNYDNVDLKQWTKPEITNAGDKYKATYNTSDVESDYDYIYFRLPSGSGWSNHVYAYFYGGGDLRAHNWQRGVYSIWPGVAPVATEYSVSNGGTDTAQHSDHYTYEYTQTLFSETPTNTGSLSGINPESTFTYNGDTVYKFRIPKSERVTYENNGKRVYDKVIFNDGSSRYSNGKETGMIGFKAGYIYSPDDTTGKKYYGEATNNYTGRGDYLYINNAANWDNLHVTFYNANGTAILQGGKGYIMQYEGTKDGKKYYRIPIPSGAAKFKINNGKGSGLESTTTGVIYPKQDSVDTSKKDYTTGDMIYTLNTNKSLTRDYPIFNDPTAVPHTSESATLQDSGVDYVTRGDKLYIRNTAEWNGMNIGAVKVKFYDSSNAVIGTTGTYTMIVSETESASVASDNRTNGAGSSTATKWYSIDIPMNAAKFELTAPHATAQQYDIYELINSDGSTDRNYKWTKGDMYYETSGSDALTLLYPTYYQSVDYTATDNYGTGNARGDNLYLVVSDLDKWKNMRVTFYNAGGAAIPNSSGDTAIVPNYIGYRSTSATNDEAAGYWFKIAIPVGAASFRATSSSSNSDSGDIYELSQNRTYHFRNDYTPGDMQYRITDTLSGGEYNLSLLYPIFTEEPYYSLNDEVNNSYPTNNITIPTPTSGTNDAPILYQTSSDTITYTWEETTEVPSSSMKIKFLNNIGWSEVWIHYYGGNSTDTNVQMTKGTQNGDGYYEWYYSIPTGTGNIQFHSGQNVWNGANQTGSYGVSSYNIGDNSQFTPNEITGFPIIVDTSDINNGSGQYYAQFTNSTTNATYSKNGKTWIEGHNAGGESPDDQVRAQWFEVPSGYDKMQLRFGNNNPKTSKLTLNIANNYGRGKYYKWNSSTNNLDTRQPFKNSIMGNTGSYVTGSWSSGQSSGTTTTTVNKSATYQPEDRYGYIANVTAIQDYASSFNSLPTTDNFVKVSVTGIDTPYIRFYDANDTLITFTGTSDVTNAVGLKVTKMTVGSTDYTGVAQSSSPYTIRIPKGAKKISVGDGTNWSSHIDLFTNYTNEFTASKSGTTVSISQNTSTPRTTNSTALQSGVTADEGFIFYKDNMTHAYYYSGVDGEFCAWPGVPYSYSYTDSSDTVYAFQIPTTSDSTAVYPYVIFNDGTVSGTNMTAAISYTGGEICENYSTTSQYGSWSASPITTNHTTKTTPTPQGDPEDTPPEYTEIHLATIVTGADGRQKYIKWLRPKPGAEDEADTEYLDHVFTDIGESANKKEVRVKKLGDYYWVETVAPVGYKVNKDKIGFTLTQADTAAGSYITHIVDEPLPGKVLLMKTAKEKVGNTDIGNALRDAKFRLTTKTDLNTSIKVARKTDKSEYYVIPDISAGATDESKEEYIALSQSGEYETISDTVTLTVPDPDNEGQTKNVTVNKLKEYTELVTDENGYIKIENLVWGDYALTETEAPDCYAITTNGTTNQVIFTIGKNNSDITQELSLKDEMNPSYIKLFEHINEKKDAWGDPTFTFRIKQTKNYVLEYDSTEQKWKRTLTDIPADKQKELLVSLTVNDDGTGNNVLASSVTSTDFTDWLVESTDEGNEYQGMYHIDSQGRIRVEPGTYEITRMPVSRYEFVTSAYTDQYNNGGTAGSQNENLYNGDPLEKVTIDGLEAGKTIDVHYYDKVGYYDKFSQADTKVNNFYTLDSNKKNAAIKGIRVENCYATDSGTVSGDTLTVYTNDTTKFRAYKIMSDGTEQQITGVDLAKLDISYTYDSGSKDDEQFDTDFSYSNPALNVNNVSRYHDSVYKLNVSYENDQSTTFTTTFDLVFEKQSTNITYYTAQVIFKNDSQDTTSANTDTNISYFEEDNNRTHAYEFTFVIADDNGTKTVSDIRHNGVSIGTDSAAWSSALSDMASKFHVLSGYSSYSFNSWTALQSIPNSTDYDDIVNYIKDQTPTDGRIDPIEFAAHLT